MVNLLSHSAVITWLNFLVQKYDPVSYFLFDIGMSIDITIVHILFMELFH